MSQILAILKESFWSAAASRLLYLELIGVALVLLALSPFYATERVSYQVAPSDIGRPQTLAKNWNDGANADENQPTRYLWDQLDEEQKSSISKIASDPQQESNMRGTIEDFRKREKIAEIVNQLIENKNFQTDDFWEEKITRSETKLLWGKRSSLSVDNEKRLRRLLIQEAFGSQIRNPAGSMATVNYAWQTLIASGNMSKLDLEQQIRSWAPFALDKLFLTIGVLMAVLVTASLIPQMLEEGSLYLLLSKPMTRVTLLLTKYVGSGILVFIISGAFLSGLWLILGVRFDVWMPEILWMIPLALIIYLVYYSVTVAAGLFFRNTIISIIATMSFALVCYTLSFSHYLYDGFLSNDRRGGIEKFGDKILTTDVKGRLHMLQDDGSWRWVFFAKSKELEQANDPSIEQTIDTIGMFVPLPQLAEPIYDPKSGLVLGEMTMVPAQPNQTFFGAARLSNSAEVRYPFNLGNVPAGTVGFAIDKNDQLMAISQYGTVWRLNEKGRQTLTEIAAGTYKSVSSENKAESESESTAESDQWDLLGTISEAGPEKAERFVYDPATDVFWAIGRTGIFKAERSEDEPFHVTRNFISPWEWSYTNRIPIVKVGNQLLVPQRSGPLVVLDADTLEVAAEFSLPIKNVPVSAASNERFAAIAYRQDGAWIYDSKNGTLEKLSAVNDLVTAVAFTSDNQLVLVQDVDRVTTVSLDSGKIVKTEQPQRSQVRLIYDLGVNPLYQFLPKPNECYAIVESLATKGFSDNARNQENIGPFQSDVDTKSAKTNNPWNPLFSSVAFAAVVMTINCIYFVRQQF